MTHDLAFLHTLAANVDAFSPLATERRPDLRVTHRVADHLLNQARQTGMTPEIAREVQSLMIDLASTGARVVVCTCSTIGGAAEATDTAGRFVAMRIDRPMADRAVTLGPDVLVLAALTSTFEPTRALLEDSARRANVPLRLQERLVEGAWPHFERGDRDAYYQVIADALATNLSGFGAVVLAQASMAPAADRCENLSVPVLSSPRMGVEAALAILWPRSS
jgi:hypothetical protein